MQNELGIDQWKKFAQQVLGRDFFNEFTEAVVEEGPKYNLYRNSSEILILVNLPYLSDLSQIKVSVREQEVQITGKIEFEYDQFEVIQSQIFAGTFEQIIPLPDRVNTKKVNAQYKRGILKIRLFPALKKKDTIVPIEDL